MAQASEREESIAKLRKLVEGIGKILREGAGGLLDMDQENRVRELKRDAEEVLRKLERDEFEIAIVGLEKAGKSTFANALMENEILPSKDKRCTYTSTKIQYDEKDSASVSFYSADEFNRDFKDKLHQIKFPEYEKYSFDTIDERTFQRICDEANVEKNDRYSIRKDIEEIIRDSDSLSRLLGRPPMSFGADEFETLEKYITEEDKARAAKQVVICSSKLKRMPNAIIYDVPGFNSPTELHRKQTLERMKAADAIVVVANGNSPSLTREVLDIFENADDEGNPFIEKLFVFANKMELSQSDIRENIEETKKEWIERRKYIKPENEDRIYFGSALAHLRKEDPLGKHKNLLPAGNGIEAIRNRLVDYNHNERFEVLKRRIRRIYATLRKLVEKVSEQNKDFDIERTYTSEHVDMIMKFIDRVREDVDNNLKQLSQQIKGDMESYPLSKQLADYIDSNITIEKYKVTDAEIDAERKETHYADLHDDVVRIENNIRAKKFETMYDDFIVTVINIAVNDHDIYSIKILDAFTNAMRSEMDPVIRDEIRELLRRELKDYRSAFGTTDHGNKEYYRTLIERFSRDIYQVLILSSYSSDRLRAFMADIDNFYSLSVFYRQDGIDDRFAYINSPLKDQPLCRKLLFHENSKGDLFEEIAKVTGISMIPEAVGEWIDKALGLPEGNREKILEVVKERFKKVTDYSEDFRINLLMQVMAGFVSDRKGRYCISDTEEFVQAYKSFHKGLRGGMTAVEDFVNDFNDDIRILADVLKNAFVRAINMEKPFRNREIKAIEDIQSKYLKSAEFRHFLSTNFPRICYKETQELDKKMREQETKAAGIKALNDIMNAINDLPKE